MTIPSSGAGGGGIEKDGRRLTNLDEWHCYAAPKGRMHWKDGRSAKENARLWLDAAPSLPVGIREVLRGCVGIGNLSSWSAEPEARAKFDAFRGPANIDLLVKAGDEHGPIVIGIEAKADEAFGSTIEKTLSEAQKRLARKPHSKGVERIQELVRTFGLDLHESEVLDLRYQLLTLTAGTLAEARRQSAQRAVVIIQEFVSSLTSAKYRARNARDLEDFLRAAFGHAGSLANGPSAGPFQIDRHRRLYFGKTVTVVQG